MIDLLYAMLFNEEVNKNNLVQNVCLAISDIVEVSDNNSLIQVNYDLLMAILSQLNESISKNNPFFNQMN